MMRNRRRMKLSIALSSTSCPPSDGRLLLARPARDRRCIMHALRVSLALQVLSLLGCEEEDSSYEGSELPAAATARYGTAAESDKIKRNIIGVAIEPGVSNREVSA